ncbi:MAG: 1-(5-phosphoribosyl)-5-amino-4-imidazole-carboxylate carboxylase, partial [Myxococcota bacterium]
MSARLRDLLSAFKRGDLSEERLLQHIAREPFEEHMIGRFDTQREVRTGVPEAIFAEGKDPAAVAEIVRTYLERDEQLIATRVTAPILAALAPMLPELYHVSLGRVVATKPPAPDPAREHVLVVSAGTLDAPVASECAECCALLGNPVERLSDVGVA